MTVSYFEIGGAHCPCGQTHFAGSSAFDRHIVEGRVKTLAPQSQRGEARHKNAEYLVRTASALIGEALR